MTVHERDCAPCLRFWPKVVASGECLLWIAYINPAGYGQFRHNGRARYSHRFAYEHFVGPIPEGLQLDHLCRVTACVNPTHLEPVTNRVNSLRSTSIMAVNAQKTHCDRGHPFDHENTYIRPDGDRDCRTCQRRRRAERRLRREVASV